MSEQKNIGFQYGIRRSPLTGADGELSECVGLMPKNGELVNLQPPSVVDGSPIMSYGDVLLFVHKTSNYTNYIVKTESNGLAWYGEDGARSLVDGSVDNVLSVTGVTAIGNTLVVGTDECIWYVIFRDGDYKWLGNKLPELGMKFGLDAAYVHHTLEDSNGDDISFEVNQPTGHNNFSYIHWMFNDENNRKMEQYILSRHNEYINKVTGDDCRFVHPFFVRYAYNTVAGYAMISPPVLMVPNAGEFPFLSFGFDCTGGSVITITKINDVSTRMYTASLVCRINEGLSDVLSGDWNDIIQSVDIFVSPPFVRNKETGEWWYYLYKEGTTTGLYPGKYLGGYGTEWMNDSDLFYRLSNISGGTYAGTILIPPMKDKEDFNEEITSNSSFFKVSSISLSDLTSDEWMYVDIEKNVLNQITSQPRLSADDYNGHDILSAKSLFSYNNRVNLAGVTRKPFGFKLDELIPYTNARNPDVEYTASDSITAVKETVSFTVYVFIKDWGETVRVVSGTCDLHTEPALNWVFYPNPNAYQIIIYRFGNMLSDYAVLPLTKHKHLNGAYYMDDSAEFSEIGGTIKWENILMSSHYRTYISEPNKIYTSESGNPFVFPLTGINTIGTGEILGLSTATKALSQGQFGQFPMYAFATDGIWAMEVNPETGTYNSVHPVSRDVCNNPRSITQIDAAIVFTTEQGLKLLQGSEVTLLSGRMDGHNIDEDIYNVCSCFDDLFVADTERFVEMLRTCHLVYDYAHGLLRIYPDGVGEVKGYAYSFDNGEFCSFIGEVPKTTIPGYPETLMQVATSVQSFRRVVSDERRKGMLITRPMSLDDPFAMKMVEDARILAYRSDKDTRIRYALFVSNDGVAWKQLTSLRRHSYKWYRVVAFTEMKDVDALTGISLQYSVTRNNKLR